MLKFKVTAIKKKRWWSVFRGAHRILLQIQHDNPNDWPLNGQLHFHVKTDDEAAAFKVGQVYDVKLTLLGE